MFGDGASNAGNFGETMNLAALWRLPVVFILENNLYGMGTAVERHSAVTDFSRKAEGMGVPGVRVDGMDVLAMRETVAEHIRIAREERRPTMVEAFTYRFRGHSAADPEVYRTKEEVEEWRKKDPVEAFADRLEGEGVLSAEERATRCASGSRRGWSTRSSSPTTRPSRRSTRSTTTSTCSATRCKGWYAVDERAPQPFAGEREGEELTGEAKRLAEAGAAYGGQAASPAGRREDDDTLERQGGRRRARGPRVVRRRPRGRGS